MDSVTANSIGKKARALKHCDKLIKKIEKHGAAKIVLNCTGVEFVVKKGDAIYHRILQTKYALLGEIQSLRITLGTPQGVKQHRPFAPAPIGASDAFPALAVPAKMGLKYASIMYARD